MNQFLFLIAGVGGVFVLEKGNAYHHIQSNCSTKPLDTLDKISKWLQYRIIPAPLISLGTFVTGKLDVDLRPQHFHSFTKSNWGGHFYHDTTPDIVKYEAFFNIAERVIRVDRPN